MKRSFVLVAIALLALSALPVAAQAKFSIGPAAGVLKIPDEDLTFLRFGASARLSLLRLLALRIDARYVMIPGEEDTWVDAAAGVEVPILLGLYAKAQGGYFLDPSGKSNFPYIEAGLGFGIGGFFVEGVYSQLFIESGAGTIGASAGFRFKL